MTARRVDALEVEVGDDLIYLGQHKRIIRTEPYDTTALFGVDIEARTAYSHDGWTVTLLPGQSWWVDRPAPSGVA